MIEAFTLVLWAASVVLAAVTGYLTAWSVGFYRGAHWEKTRAQARWDGRDRRGVRAPTDTGELHATKPPTARQ